MASDFNSMFRLVFDFDNSKGNRNVRATGRAINDLNKNIANNSRAFDKAKKSIDRTNDSGLRFRVTTSGMKRTLGAIRNELLVLAFAFGGVVAAMQKAIQATVELEAALLGLGAVAEKTGNSRFKAMEEATKLAATGLITVKEASAGLKNLLSTGQFTLQQSVDIMKALGDAAAFNRQGTLSYGEAVVGATQGIKNQNSIMTDNAGITKNLSIMYEEYAAQLGTTAGKLTEAQKFQAIYNGMLEEASIFAGNAALVTETLSGAQSKLGVSVFNLRALFGDIISVVYKPMLGLIQRIVDATQKWLKVNEDLIKLKLDEYLKKVVTFTKALWETIEPFGRATGKALAVLKPFAGILVQLFIVRKLMGLVGGLSKAFLGLGGVLKKLVPTLSVVRGFFTVGGLGIGVLLSKFAAAALVITGIITLIGKLRKSREETTDRVKQLDKVEIKSNMDLVQGLRDREGEIVKLGREYNNLASDASNAIDKEAKLKKIESEMNRLLPDLINNTDDYATKLNKIASAAGDAELELDKMNERMLKVAELDLTTKLMDTSTNMEMATRKSNKSMQDLELSALSVGKSLKDPITKLDVFSSKLASTTIRNSGFQFGMLKTTEEAKNFSNALLDAELKLAKEYTQLRLNKDMTEAQRFELDKVGEAYKKVQQMRQEIGDIVALIDAEKKYEQQLKNVQFALNNTAEATRMSVSQALAEVEKMEGKFTADSMIKIIGGIEGNMQRLTVPLKEARKEIERLKQEFGGKFTFGLTIQPIDISKQVMTASTQIETELKRIKGVDIKALVDPFVDRLKEVGVEEKKIADKMDTISDKFRDIQRQYENRVQKALEISKLEKEGSVPIEHKVKALALLAEAQSELKIETEKYFETWLKGGSDTDKILLRLNKRIDNFVRQGLKARAEASIRMWDNILGGDSVAREDRIRKARDTQRQLIIDLKTFAQKHGMDVIQMKIREKEIIDSYNQIIINENKKFYEQRLNTMIDFMEKLVGGFDQLGAAIADRGLGINKEQERRIKEVQKMFKDEVITFEEKEKQITAIKRAANEERLKMEKKFWFNMVKVVTDSVSQILKQYAIESAAKAMAKAQAANPALGIGGLLGAVPGMSWGALALGVGIPILSGFLSRRSELREEDRGFAGLGQAERAGSGAQQDRLTGAVTARELQIVIAPSIQIEGETVVIGQVGVEELRSTIGQVAVEATRQAIENRELDLSRIT